MTQSAFTRKYRPKKIKDVIGQEVAVRIISNSFKMNRLYHAYLFVGKYGTGKCITADSIVSTPRGMFRIEDLVPRENISVINQPVLDETGVGISEHGYYESEADTFYIETEDGFSIQGTPEHRVRVLSEIGNIEWKRIDEIKEGDYLAINRKDCWTEFEPPEISYVFDKYDYLSKTYSSIKSLNGAKSNILDYVIDIKIDSKIARTIGFILAEGHISNKKVSISNTDEEIIRDIAETFDKLGIEYSEYEDNRRDKKQFVISCGRISISEFFRYLGLSEKSKNKRVPSLILKSPRHIVMGFLSAYFEGDGGINGDAVSAYSTSRSLLSDIQIMLLQFGIVSHLKRCDKTCTNCKRKDKFESYCLNLYGQNVYLFNEKIGFYSERKNNKLACIVKGQFNPNKDIIPYWQKKLLDMRSKISLSKNGMAKGKEGFFRGPKWNSNIRNNHSCHKNVTYQNLIESFNYFSIVNSKIDKNIDLSLLERIINTNYYYSKVCIKKNSGKTEVFDLAKLDSDHSFYANGIINHNTSLGRIVAAHAHQGIGPDEDLDMNDKDVRDIFAGESIDVIEMDAASSRKIEDVRNLKKDSLYAPISGRKKIFLIDEAHSFTKEAFNALLKLIEEPPPQLMFILCTTDVEKIPSTIASRCVRLDFMPLDWHEIYSQLKIIAKSEFESFDESALKLIAKNSDGSLRNALNSLEKVYTFSGKPEITLEDTQKTLGMIGDDLYIDLLDSIFSRNLANALKCVNTIMQNRVNADDILKGIENNLKSLLNVKVSDDKLIGNLLSSDEITRYEHLGKKVSYPLVARIIGLLVNVRKGIDVNIDTQTIIDSWAIDSIVETTTFLRKEKGQT